ncbi:hypothetical protein AOLI_G00246040 [Acnodon oligacanthus]
MNILPTFLAVRKVVDLLRGSLASYNTEEANSKMNETLESSSAEVVPPVDSAAQDEAKASECPLEDTDDAAV